MSTLENASLCASAGEHIAFVRAVVAASRAGTGPKSPFAIGHGAGVHSPSLLKAKAGSILAISLAESRAAFARFFQLRVAARNSSSMR